MESKSENDLAMPSAILSRLNELNILEVGLDLFDVSIPSEEDIKSTDLRHYLMMDRLIMLLCGLKIFVENEVLLSSKKMAEFKLKYGVPGNAYPTLDVKNSVVQDKFYDLFNKVKKMLLEISSTFTDKLAPK